jgi:AcrR family transcriptional regulator
MAHLNSVDAGSDMQDEGAPARRPRGRPQVRTDEDTLEILIAAAREEFLAHGFAAANMASVAQKAGVSTKTLYRLVPTKAELFRKIVSSRMEIFALALDLDPLDALPPEDALAHLLTVYGDLSLSEDATGMYRLAVTEGARFPELAAFFYEAAVESGGRALEAWLARQRDRGILALNDLAQASGMLRGMMIMEGQRAALLRRRPLPNKTEIAVRAQACARLFLNGCRAAVPGEPG